MTNDERIAIEFTWSCIAIGGSGNNVSIVKKDDGPRLIVGQTAFAIEFKQDDELTREFREAQSEGAGHYHGNVTWVQRIRRVGGRLRKAFKVWDIGIHIPRV